MSMTAIAKRNNVRVTGKGQKPMLFAHGFGCDQHMWRFVAPAFEDAFRVIVFDHVGAGGSDLSAYSSQRYNSLAGYADDVLQLCEAFDIHDGVFVGHSVSAMIGVLAANTQPDRFSDLVLVAPSPCYINVDDYVGGFSRADIDGLLDALDSNYFGWSSTMAPVIMGNADRPELGAELTNSFCRTDPAIAKEFAQVTFLSDCRADLPHVKPHCLIMQCSQDVIAPTAVGEYMHRSLPSSELVMLQATGHCPNLSAPAETITHMKAFVHRA